MAEPQLRQLPYAPESRLRVAHAKAAEAKAGIWSTLGALTIVLALALMAVTPAVVVWLYTALL